MYIVGFFDSGNYIFKGDNYSREETVRGNTVFQNYSLHPAVLFDDQEAKKKLFATWSIRKEVANKVNKEGAKKLDNELKIVPNI